MSDEFYDRTGRSRATSRQRQAQQDARSVSRRQSLDDSARRYQAQSEQRRRASHEAAKRRIERGKKASEESAKREQQRSMHGRTSDIPSRSARVGMPAPTSPSRGYTANRARKMQKRVSAHTVGSHVDRSAPQRSHRSEVTEAIRRRARFRRFVAGVLGVVIVVGIALTAGILAFRGNVGSSMALKDSDAVEVLTPVEAGEPYFVLFSVELGAVAQPLENPGPDCLILARVDNAHQSIGLINIPANLQVTYENKTFALSSIAEQGDAKLISALSAFTKVNITHFVKIDEQGLSNMVDRLDGIQVDLEQVIDDPQAGDVYLPSGAYTLNGSSALYYLRATNLKNGTQDKLSHQLTFATLVFERLFGKGLVSTNIDAVDDCFQTDASLADMEAIASWFNGRSAKDILIANLPGYTTGVTNIDQNGEQRYISSYEDFMSVLEAIESGQSPTSNDTDNVDAADPSSFTVEVQNGTSISGLAAATAETLTELGFNVGEVGNADVQANEETLVIYKGETGLAQAKSIIEALGIGRTVGSYEYYEFEGDVLLIIGSDYSPVS